MNLIPKRKYAGAPAVQESTIQETIGRIGTLTVDNLNASVITAGDIAVDRIKANAANAVNGGSILISAAKINISGDCTFSSGYNPTIKTTTFVQTSIPTSVKAGDLWIDTDDGNKIYRADSVGADEIKAGEWVLTSDLTAKITLFQQAKASIPTSIAVGDLWVTTDGNETYRAAMVGANEIKAGEWVLVDTAAAINTGTTTISGGKITTNTIDCNRLTTSTLDAITITLGAAGKFVTGAAGTNRIEITSASVVGYNAANSPQFYLQSSDGKAYCGGGAVILDNTGILIIGGSGAAALRFKNALADGTWGEIWNSAAGYLDIGAANGLHLGSDSSYVRVYGTDFRPQNTAIDLGTSALYWRTLYVMNITGAHTGTVDLSSTHALVMPNSVNGTASGSIYCDGADVWVRIGAAWKKLAWA
jgi:hypothetical protein